MGLDRSSWGHISKWEWLVRINVFHFLLNAILKTKALLFVCFFLLFLQPECTNLGQLERYCTNWVALVSAKSLLKVWTIWRLNRDLKLISSKKPFSLKRATAPPKFSVANLDYLLPLLEIAIIWQLPQHLDVSWMFPAMAGLGAGPQVQLLAPAAALLLPASAFQPGGIWRVTIFAIFVKGFLSKVPWMQAAHSFHPVYTTCNPFQPSPLISLKLCFYELEICNFVVVVVSATTGALHQCSFL